MAISATSKRKSIYWFTPFKVLLKKTKKLQNKKFYNQIFSSAWTFFQMETPWMKNADEKSCQMQTDVMSRTEWSNKTVPLTDPTITRGDAKCMWASASQLQKITYMKRRTRRRAASTQSRVRQKSCRFTDHHSGTVYVKNPAKVISHCQMEPDRKKGGKKSVLKHTLLSSSIADRTHKRAICQTPYARKGMGKNSGTLVTLMQESHTETETVQAYLTLEFVWWIWIKNKQKKSGIWKILVSTSAP